MKESKNKIKVFVSSKVGTKVVDQKYIVARTAVKEILEGTKLFDVYLFEGEGSSTYSAYEHYTENLSECDVCIFLIDNKDGVPQGVQIELEEVEKFKIPALYYFCDERSKSKTSAQLNLEKAHLPKHTNVKSFSEFIEICPEDLITDVLRTFKNFAKVKKNEENTQSTFTDDSNNGTNYTNLQNDETKLILSKNKLSNSISRNYFENLILGNQLEEIESNPNPFDYQSAKFLQVMFEGATIHDFNMNLFIESLKKIFPPKYFEIIEKRWYSIQSYYIGDFEGSLELLKEALALAEAEESQIDEWIVQDILIDLRNRENKIAQYKNEVLFETIGQKGLDEREGKLYYPILDRSEKNLLEWIEHERQTDEMQSYNSWRTYGDLSRITNYIADFFTLAMMFGSLTHLTRTYMLIQRLTYQFARTIKDWPSCLLLLKTTILNLNYKEASKIFSNFPDMMKQMNARDAKSIYNFSNNAKPEPDKFSANLIAMSQIGYYLSNEDFEHYWKSLQKRIDEWNNDEKSIVSMQSLIFKCLKDIGERIDGNYIVEFGISILESKKRRYHRETLELLSMNGIHYESLKTDTSNKLIDVLIKYAEDSNDSNDHKAIRYLFVRLSTMDSDHKVKMEEFLKEAWPDFFAVDYMFEKKLDRKTGELLLEKFINSIDSRNSSQGINGVIHGYATDPYESSKNVLKATKENIDESILCRLLTVTVDTILVENQTIEAKVSAYRLVIFIAKDRQDIIKLDRNAEMISKLINYKNYERAKETMSSYLDNTSLILCHMLLLETFGKNRYTELVEVLALFNEPRRQVEGCKVILDFLHNIEGVSIRPALVSLFIQSSLLWANSSNISVRANNALLQVKLYELRTYRRMIGQKLYEIVEFDSAIVKSRIVSSMEKIDVIDPKLAQKIRTKATEDSHFVIRKIVNDK
ncbi:hypothetical protein ACR77M_22185 [Enterococcus avium]|uniref:hypothetical protein n=1 Tax=Enterococcus avium TaxID=33945 RepID=UPI003DA20FEB